MKRTITTIFAIMLVLVMVMSLSACGGNDKTTKSLIGNWYSFTDTGIFTHTPVCLEFKDNGECVYDGTKGKFTIDKDNKKILAQFTNVGSATMTYELDDGKIVSITIGKNKFKKENSPQTN